MGMSRQSLIKNGMAPQKWMRDITGAGRKSIKRETKRRRRKRGKRAIESVKWDLEGNLCEP